MKHLLWLLCLVLLTASASWAGPNADGTLIISLVEEVFTDYPDDFCGLAEVDCIGPVRHDATSLVALRVAAVFPEASVPRLTAATFGMAYNEDEIFLRAFGACGDFELSTSDWPESGEGTAITFAEAQTETVVDLYWFVAYNYYANPNSLDLIAHPSQGANFADDSIPAVLDPVVALGSFGFSTDGSLPCPEEGSFGACCFPDGSCEVLREEDCNSSGGEFEGSGTDCDLGCEGPPIGACCLSGGECEIRTEQECRDSGGEYLGDDVPCDGDPCATPVYDSSWGTLKRHYR